MLEQLRKAVVAFNELKDQGLIEDYAIGGGMATNFYTDPQSTFDLDVFILVGRWEEAGHIVLDQLPIQLITAGSPLDHEAIERALPQPVAGIEARVISAEHLVAIALRTGRRKDFEKVRRLLEEAPVDRRKLGPLLKRHHLYDTFKRWELQNRN
jgi:hypothetical protein